MDKRLRYGWLVWYKQLKLNKYYDSAIRGAGGVTPSLSWCELVKHDEFECAKDELVGRVGGDKLLCNERNCFGRNAMKHRQKPGGRHYHSIRNSFIFLHKVVLPMPNSSAAFERL